MARYIDANKLQEDFEKIADESDYMHEGETWQTGIYLAGTITDMQPTSDVVEVKHGEWKRKGQDIYCSVCGNESAYNPFGASKFSDYCPNCGAKMDGRRDT